MDPWMQALGDSARRSAYASFAGLLGDLISGLGLQTTVPEPPKLLKEGPTVALQHGHNNCLQGYMIQGVWKLLVRGISGHGRRLMDLAAGHEDVRLRAFEFGLMRRGIKAFALEGVVSLMWIAMQRNAKGP